MQKGCSHLKGDGNAPMLIDGARIKAWIN